MKSMLERIEEQRREKLIGAKQGKLCRIHVRLTANATARINSSSVYLISVGNDHLELSTSAEGASPFLLDRKQIAEVFFG